MRTYCWWIRGAEFAELAKLSIASVRKLEPFSIERRLVVYTDEESPAWECDLAPHGSGIELRYLRPGRPAMVANLDAQVDAVLTANHGEKLLFLDADTLLRKPFPWTNGIDLYTTWRDHVNGDREMAKYQPYNYGVVGAVANAATIEAFIWLRARILQMSPDNQDWYGNQLALASLLGQPRAEPWTARIRWTLSDEGSPLRVDALPCDVWNFSPNTPDEDVSEKGILHLKGNRKDLMQHFAREAA
jgi:hypothetical protein